MNALLEKYGQIWAGSFVGYGDYLLGEVLHPHAGNYFYGLIGVSLLCWLLEILFPWRKGQRIFRPDFWLDAFYLFFNYFLFSLIGYNAWSDVAVEAFRDGLRAMGIHQLV